MVRAHASGQVGAAGQRGVVLPLGDLEQTRVVCLDGDVDGGRGEVEGADGVTDQHVGVPVGLVVLIVRAAPLDVGEDIVAAAVDEEPRLLEVAGIAGLAGEFGKRDLDLGVSADLLVRPVRELGDDVVGGPQRHAHDAAFSMPSADPGDGGLDQVAVAVQLVAPLEVGVARLLARVVEVRVEIAVLALHGLDHRPEALDLRVQLRVPGAAHLPRHRLDQLVDVRVGELASVAVLGDGAVERVDEVVDPTDLRLPLQGVRDDRVDVELLTLAPEATVDRDQVDPDRSCLAGGGRDGYRCGVHVISLDCSGLSP